MCTIPKEAIHELIKQSNFKSTSDVMEAINGMFKDVIQEVMGKRQSSWYLDVYKIKIPAE